MLLLNKLLEAWQRGGVKWIVWAFFLPAPRPLLGTEEFFFRLLWRTDA